MSRLKKGFSLIELIIVLSIIAILLSLLVANFNLGFSFANLNSSQSSIYHNLRLAQNHAMSNRSYNEFLPAYWGLNFKKGDDFFYFFADLDGDLRMSPGESEKDWGGKKVKLASNVFINYLSWEIPEINVLFEIGSGKMLLYIPSENHILTSKPVQIELGDRRYDRVGKIISLGLWRFIQLDDCDCLNSEGYCCHFCWQQDPCINIEN